MAAPKGNKFGIGNDGGAPRKYTDPKKLQNRIDKYFLMVQGQWHMELQDVEDEETGGIKKVAVKVWDRYPEPTTLTGLCLFLGFHCLETFSDYEKREEFAVVTKMARLKVLNGYEHRLHGDKPVGAIFALKNIGGWADKQETTHAGLPETKPLQVNVYNSAPPLAGSEDEIES